jgi:flagellar hook protein FlgE
MALGLFQTSVLGMSSQSHALDVIGANIANASTGGYKRAETGFATLLSDRVATGSADAGTLSPGSIQSDLGGVRSYDLARVSETGEYATTGRNLDIAIEGRGFFVMNSAVDGSGATVYGRDGRLAEAVAGAPAGSGAATVGVQQGYLVDKNGYFLQGWAAADGTVPAGGPLTALRVDPDAFTVAGEATTRAALAVNLPAVAAEGTIETRGIDVFDSAWRQHSVQLSFTKSRESPLTWTLAVDDSPVGELRFGSDGRILAPQALDLALTFPGGDGTGGTTARFTLDVSGFTQYAAGFSLYDYARDGYAPGALSGIRFDDAGDVVGEFDNGRTRTLYRLAIADFADPDGLGRLPGDVWAETAGSGVARLAGAGDGGRGTIAAETLELSNVDLGDEFGRMILTQNAYNASATSFRTLDEMTQVAVDLYR